MTAITISRAYYSDCTLGRLFAFGFSCHTLELPWLGNAPNVSCIPEGEYNYRVAISPRLKRDVIWVDGVDGRYAIQIHPGNYTSQIQGCILPGSGIQDINKDGTPDVINSGATFDLLLKSISERGIITFRTADQPGKGVYK